MGRGALYYHIRSKEDLLWECHNRHVDPMLDLALELEAAAIPAREKLRALSHRLVEIIARYQAYITVFYREMTALSPERMAELVKKRRAFEDAIERIIRQGIEAGELRQEDPRMCVLAFLGMHNWVFHWYNRQGRLQPEEIAEIFIGIFLRGMEQLDS